MGSNETFKYPDEMFLIGCHNQGEGDLPLRPFRLKPFKEKGFSQAVGVLTLKYPPTYLPPVG